VDEQEKNGIKEELLHIFSFLRSSPTIHLDLDRVSFSCQKIKEKVSNYIHFTQEVYGICSPYLKG
jgi:hypothetical protein